MLALCGIFYGVVKWMAYKIECLDDQLKVCNAHVQLMEERRFIKDSITEEHLWDLAARKSYTKIIQPTLDSIKIVNNIQ
jgi:hypothetical protein